MTVTLLVSKHSSNYSSESIRRKTVGLTLRQDLLSLAREKRINLSKLLENALIGAFEAQTRPFSLSEGSLLAKRESSWRARRDLNPRSPAPKAGALILAGRRALIE